MTPRTIPPTHIPAPFHTSEAPWMESNGWSYDHRVSGDRVLCLGQRTVVELVPSTGEKRKCPRCLEVVGPSAL